MQTETQTGESLIPTPAPVEQNPNRTPPHRTAPNPTTPNPTPLHEPTIQSLTAPPMPVRKVERKTDAPKTVAQKAGRPMGAAAARAKAKAEGKNEQSRSKPNRTAPNPTGPDQTATIPGRTKQPTIHKPASKASKYADTMKITVLLKKNPHREDSAAGKRFALFRTGMTVGEWRKKAIAAKLAKDGHGHLRVHVRAGHVKVA